MRAIGYFRETRAQSLAEQSEAFLAFCRSNGYEAAAAFLDGKTDPRSDGDTAGFRQLLDFTRQQAPSGFLVVVVAGLASLGENITEAARRYFQMASVGVPIISIETGEDVSAPLLEKWSEHRAAGSLGDRVKAAMRRRAIKGEALGRPPYGYKVGPKKRLVVVPEEGSVVRYIFRLYLKDGLGIRRIARRLNEDGLRTRRVGLWSMVTVRDILRNRAYVGTYSRFGVRVPASHAPLISQEDFQCVQERLDQRRPASEVRNVSPFLLSGITYCGYCGNKMIGVTRKQKWVRRSDQSVRTAQYRYYQCESRTNRSLCDYHTRRADELEAEVRMRLLATKPPTPPKQSANGDLRGSEEDVRRLRDKARRLDKRLEQYMDDAALGNINREKLQALGLALATEQMQLEDHLVESTRAARRLASDSERRGRHELLLDRLRDEWKQLDFMQQQELVRDIVSRIVVKDDGFEIVLRP
ncbi:MAG TPA: recombinase family protein [Dehalococcoidia bacterium]|nr:recombinase family protein [Dehalococcoidia bacterium]